MGLTESLYDYVISSKNPALHPDHLHRCARLWGRCFWGEQYPDQEVLDDIENYRALELLHAGFCFRHRTWKVLVGAGAGTDTTDSLYSEILSTRDVCRLFLVLQHGVLRPNTMFFYSSLAIFRPLHHRKIRRHRLGAAHSQHNLHGRVHLLRADHPASPTPLRRQPPCGYTPASHGRHLRHCAKTIRLRSATSPAPALAAFDGRD